ncbi:hypothetical protein [Pseudomonas sp. p1(2021b)]|uniref:hypothetical protein n=1 Tax=Pseudomonas sp. p1(2021b) TaxID=2874628 RepID=UPI003D2C41B0
MSDIKFSSYVPTSYIYDVEQIHLMYKDDIQALMERVKELESALAKAQEQYDFLVSAYA